jgi:murein DD-endopeptidase MepM/ murein hydrolase activator NlpD
MHTGIDISAHSGTPIKAAAGGEVVFAGWWGGYGNVVIIDHGGGISTLYAHCSAIYVRKGQSVSQGEVIAAVGSTGLSTGPHLHFEVRKNGKPVDPLGYL